MIKKLTLFVIVVLLGCDAEPILFKGPYFVRFTEATATERESITSTVAIELHLVGLALDHDLTISYSIAGSAREGVDYEIIGNRGQAIIPAGEYFTSIQVHLINNANNILRNQNVILTIHTVNEGGIQVGQGISGMGKSFIFTILDDCILGGTYTGSKDNLTVPIKGITVTSIDCEEYILSNWDIHIFEFPGVRDLIFVDNGDNTLTIPDQEEETFVEEFATMRGSGIVDPVTGNLIMTVELVDFKEEDEPEAPKFTFTLKRE